MKKSVHNSVSLVFILAVFLLFSQTASADLTPVDIWTGNVGLSIDAVGGNDTPVGDIRADIPTGATILAAYLYSAGTPSPWIDGSPTTAADYNDAGITLAGQDVNNFKTLVGAVSGRDDFGRWYTGRADVTTVVQSLVDSTSPAPDYYNWSISKSSLNDRIDGEVLAIVYEEASLPQSSVVLLDGGQNTDGETTIVNFADPLGNVNDPNFFADMSLGISFSTGYLNPVLDQVSNVDINGQRLTSAAGGFDDGVPGNGGLITAGGIGDLNTNPADPDLISESDDELYDLSPFLNTGDASFEIFTENPTDDDNIFFMGLHVYAEIESVDVNPSVDPDPPVDPPVNPVPEPATVLLLGTGLAGLMGFYRRKIR